MASDEDLKLSDMLRYYMRDSQAAKVSYGPRTNFRAGGWQGWSNRGGQADEAMGNSDPAPLLAPGPAVPAASSTG